MKIEFMQNSITGRKGEILDSALQVFMEKGYDGGSMRDIAQITGVTEPALYRHFDNKEELFNQLIIASGKIVVGEALELIESIDPNNLRASLIRIFDDRKKAAKIYFPMMKTIILECIRRPTFMNTFQENLAGPVIQKLEQVIARIDDYFGHYNSPEQTRNKVRIFLSLFGGYAVSSLIFHESDSATIADYIIKNMDWPGQGYQFREDLFLADLPKDFNIIKKDELKQKMSGPSFCQQTTVLDLRGKEAFEKDHIPCSIQTLIKELPNNYKKLLPDKNKEIIVVCSGGMQSIYAVMYLRMKNYRNVKSLGGGFSKWNQE